MRIVVTGRTGQVARSLLDAAAANQAEVLPLDRSVLDLAAPGDVVAAFQPLHPDLIVSAAAFTAVDKAEAEPDLAFAVNGAGAGAVARAAETLGVPVIHLSTDYVFDGTKAGAYVETDAVNPLSVYGKSKLEGERQVAAVPDHAILRTSWVYSAYGRNFVKTMIALGAEKPRLRIVCDQIGAPTSAEDIAQAVLRIARQMLASPDPGLRGTFHMTSRGETSWAEFAQVIFATLRQRGFPAAEIEPITTREFGAPAPRPLNSRLACDRLAAAHGVSLPDWQASLASCLERLAP